MDVTQVEQFAALADNWREAETDEEPAASQAFEDELHARITTDEIATIRGLDPVSGEPSAAESDRLRNALQRMWNNASHRLG